MTGQGWAPQLDVVLEVETDRLRLTRSFQLFDAHPIARTWANVENAGAVQASRGFFVGRG